MLAYLHIYKAQQAFLQCRFIDGSEIIMHTLLFQIAAMHTTNLSLSYSTSPPRNANLSRYVSIHTMYDLLYLVLHGIQLSLVIAVSYT